MKCIKAIRASKEVQLGEIKRVDNKTAMNMVGLSWEYVSKSEWKKETRKSKAQETVTEEVKEKKEYKKGERSEKHKNK